MRSINRLTILGNLGKITELGKILKLNVATNRRFKHEGKTVEVTDWITVTVLSEQTVTFIKDHVSIGERVYIEARVANSSYTKNGETIYTVDIIATLFNRLESDEQPDEE